MTPKRSAVRVRATTALGRSVSLESDDQGRLRSRSRWAPLEGWAEKSRESVSCGCMKRACGMWTKQKGKNAQDRRLRTYDTVWDGISVW